VPTDELRPRLAREGMFNVRDLGGLPVADGQVVAVHRRCLEKQAMVLDPVHYLATLGRKPATLDHAPVFRDWKLPACFALLRSELERIHGPAGGSRRIVKVLQLLGQHPLDRVAQAIASCLNDHVFDAEAVIQRTQTMARQDVAHSRSQPDIEPGLDPAVRVEVPRPNLSRFDQLLCDTIATRPAGILFR